jgi:pimeloyl-ACP methyl ester carboxylesterase
VLQYYKAKINLMHVINARWAAASAIDLFTRPYGRRHRKDPEIWKEAQPLRLSSGGLTLQGYQWNPDSPGQRQLLIIHGFGGNSRAFDRFIRPALRLGYSVVAYDAPGHGNSQGNRLNVIIYKWMLQDVLKQHGHFDAYIAHSLGAMSLALAMEEGVANHAAKIVLVAPLVEASRAADSFFSFLELPEALRTHFEAEIEKRAGYSLRWFSLPRILPGLSGKVLWVHDETDLTTPYADVYPLMEVSPPGVEFFITRGLGHSAIYRDNKVRKKIIDFLDAIPPV